MKTTHSQAPGVSRVAREEFWIVAKTFFAPIYLMILLWRRLSRSGRARAKGEDPAEAWMAAAE